MMDCSGKFLILKEQLVATTHEDETRYNELHLERGSIVIFLSMNKHSAGQKKDGQFYQLMV